MRSGQPITVTIRLTLLAVLATAMTSLPFRPVWVATALANAVRHHVPSHSPHAQVIHKLTTMGAAKRSPVDRRDRVVSTTERIPAPFSSRPSRASSPTRHLAPPFGCSGRHALVPLRC